MFTLVLYYHKYVGLMWCFLAQNTLHFNRRDRYIQNAKKHLEFLENVKQAIERKRKSTK